MKKYFYFILTFLVLIVFIVPVAGLLFAPNKLRSFVYRELSYLVMSRHITQDEKTDINKISKIFEYIHNHMHTPPGYPVIDKTVLNDFVRGVAWCDQQSWALAHLADKIGIRGSMVMLAGYQRISGHTVAHLFIDGEYKIYDPLYGLIFLNKKTSKIATFKDFSNRPKELYSEKFEALRHTNPEFTKTYFKFYSSKFPPTIWSDIGASRPIVKKLTIAILNLNYTIFGDKYAFFLQDLYLKNHSQYLKARHYHIFNRYKDAEHIYLQGLSNKLQSNQNIRFDEILYHLGSLYYDAGNYEKAKLTLHKLLEQHPQTSWLSPAHFYLGSVYKKLGELKLAYKYFKFSSSNPNNNSALELARIAK